MAMEKENTVELKQDDIVFILSCPLPPRDQRAGRVSVVVVGPPLRNVGEGVFLPADHTLPYGSPLRYGDLRPMLSRPLHARPPVPPTMCHTCGGRIHGGDTVGRPYLSGEGLSHGRCIGIRGEYVAMPNGGEAEFDIRRLTNPR